MKCLSCGHEDYTIITNTGRAAPQTITMNITVTTGGDPGPTYRFHLNCECCKNNHKDARAKVIG